MSLNHYAAYGYLTLAIAAVLIALLRQDATSIERCEMTYSTETCQHMLNR